MKGGSVAGSTGLTSQSGDVGAIKTLFTTLAHWQHDTSLPKGLLLMGVLLEVLQLLQFFYSPWWDHSYPIVKESAYFVGFWNLSFLWDHHYWGMSQDLNNYIVVLGCILGVIAVACIFMLLQFTDVITTMTPMSLPVQLLFRGIGSSLMIPLFQIFYAPWYCNADGQVTLFPKNDCGSGIHLGSIVLSCVGVVFLLATALPLSILMGKDDPTSPAWTTRTHHTVDVMTTVYKFLAATLFHIFIPHGNKTPFTVLMVLLTVPVLLSLATMLPYTELSANRFYCALYSVLLFLATENALAHWISAKWYIDAHVHSQLVLCGVPIAALLGSTLPWIRVSHQLLYYTEFCKKFGYAPTHKSFLPFRRGMVSGETRLLPHRYATIDKEILSAHSQNEHLHLTRRQRAELEQAEICVPFIHDVRIPSDAELAARFISHIQRQGLHTHPSAQMLSFSCKIFVKALVYFKRSPLVQYHFACYLFTQGGRPQLALELLTELLRDPGGRVPGIVLYPVFKLSKVLRGLFGLHDAAYEKSVAKLRHQHRGTLHDIYQFWGKLVETTADVVSVGQLSSQISQKKLSTNSMYNSHIADSKSPNRDLLYLYSLFLEKIMQDSTGSSRIKGLADEIGQLKEQRLAQGGGGDKDAPGGGGGSVTGSAGSKGTSGGSGGGGSGGMNGEAQILANLTQTLEDIRSSKDDNGGGGGVGVTGGGSAPSGGGASGVDAGGAAKQGGGGGGPVSGGGSQQQDASLGNFKLLLGSMLICLILISATIAGLHLYIAQFAQWQAESVHHQGRAHTSLYQGIALGTTCSDFANQCPELFSDVSVVATATSAETTVNGTVEPAVILDTSCLLTDYQTCLNGLRSAEVALREAQNKVTYGDFGLEQSSYGIPGEYNTYSDRMKKSSLVIQPTGAFSFEPSEPEHGAVRGIPELWSTSNGWLLIHQASLAMTDLVTRLLLGTENYDGSIGGSSVETDFLVQIPTMLHTELEILRAEQLSLSGTTQNIVLTIGLIVFGGGVLMLLTAFLALRSVLHQVSGSKVVILRLFKLIPLPVLNTLCNDARINFESFTALQVGGEGDKPEDLQMDSDSDDDLLDDDDLPAGDGGAADSGDGVELLAAPSINVEKPNQAQASQSHSQSHSPKNKGSVSGDGGKRLGLGGHGSSMSLKKEQSLSAGGNLEFDKQWSLNEKDAIFGDDDLLAPQEEQRKQSLFFFGVDPNAANSSGGGGGGSTSLSKSTQGGAKPPKKPTKPVSILKNADGGGKLMHHHQPIVTSKKKKNVGNKRVHWGDDVLQQEKVKESATAKGRQRLAEPTLLLDKRANKVVEDFARTMKEAATLELQEYTSQREQKVIELEKVMMKGSASMTRMAPKMDTARATLSRLRILLYLVVFTMMGTSIAGAALSIYVSGEHTRLNTAEAKMKDDILHILEFQAATYDQFNSARFFVTTGELSYYHHYYEQRTVIKEAGDTLATSLLNEEGKQLLRLALDPYNQLGRNAEVAMALAYRSKGIDPTKVPYLSSLHWDERPETPELQLQFVQSVTGLPLYHSLEYYQQSEYEVLVAAATAEGNVLSNMSATARATATATTMTMLTAAADIIQIGENSNIMQNDVFLTLDTAFQTYLTVVEGTLDNLHLDLFPIISVCIGLAAAVMVLTVVAAGLLVKLIREKPPHLDLYSVFPISSASFNQPTNIFTCILLIGLLVTSAICVASASKLVTGLHGSEQEQLQLDDISRRFNHTQVEVDKVIRAASWYAILGNQLAEIPLRELRGTVEESLLELYSEVESVAVGDDSHSVPSRSELSVALHEVLLIADIAVFLRARAEGISTDSTAAYIQSYDIKQEPNYATDSILYDFPGDALQYTTSEADLQKDNSVLVAMARHIISGDRSYNYQTHFATLLYDLETTTLKGLTKQRAENEDSRNTNVASITICFSVITVVLFMLIVEPELRRSLEVKDESAVAMMKTLFGKFNLYNAAAVGILLVLLVLQVTFLALTIEFPASAAESLRLSHDRGANAVLSANIVEMAYTAIQDNAVEVLADKQTDLGAVIDQIEEDRSLIVAAGTIAWTYGKVHLGTTAQEDIRHGRGELSLSQQMQTWLDNLNVVYTTAVQVHTIPVTLTPTTDSSTASTTSSDDATTTATTTTVTFEGITATTALDTTTTTAFLAGIAELRASMSSLITVLDESSDQYLADVKTQATVDLRVPAIVLMIAMVAASLFCTKVVFFPMVDELVLEVRGTSSLLTMIPNAVRPFVPKIGQFLETGALIENEQDLMAYARPEALIEEFRLSFRNTSSPLADSYIILEERAPPGMGCCLINHLGVVWHVNPQFTELLGYEASEIVGQNIKMIVQEPLRSMHDGFLSRYVLQGTSRVINTGRDVPGLKADGELIHLFLQLAEMARDNGELFFMGILEWYDPARVLQHVDTNNQ